MVRVEGDGLIRHLRDTHGYQLALRPLQRDTLSHGQFLRARHLLISDRKDHGRIHLAVRLERHQVHIHGLSDLHIGHGLIESGNHHARTADELQRLAPVIRRIKLCPVIKRSAVVRPAGLPHVQSRDHGTVMTSAAASAAALSAGMPLFMVIVMITVYAGVLQLAAEIGCHRLIRVSGCTRTELDTLLRQRCMRACADAALILRAKIILFHRSEANYPKALADMKGIITSHRYSLDPDFSHLWLKDGEWGSENIFNVSASSTNGEGMGFVHGLGGRNLSDPRSAAQGGLLEGYGQCTIEQPVYDMFEAGDKRREGTIIVYADEAAKVAAMVASGELPAGSTFSVSSEQENYAGYGHFKYAPRKESTGAIDPQNNHGTPFRFYRYADVLLLGTELAVRTGSVDTEAQGWFNDVRDRAFGDKNHRINLGSMSKEAALDVLFKERGYEFYDEMQRWFDIMRFDKGTEILGRKGWTEKYRYFPIDQGEIDRSNGNLTQNPGWAN